ncbi:flagellar basal body protein FliL [Micromonospora sp. NPDC049559]|uniref:LppU/SCO3897 family protein n=1 Tax=Micromonospora sp. NPDC049559 TaxID=3155923 RepID=UPI00342DED4E
MSNYGPPGGPTSGQPQQPWPDRQSQEPYTPPADPWRDQDPWTGLAPPAATSSSGYVDQHTGYPYPGYEQQVPAHPGVAPALAPHTTPPPRRRTGLLVGAFVAVAVLFCGGGAAAYYLVAQKEDPTPTPSASGTVTPTPTGRSSPSAEPQASAPASEPSTDARFVKAGQCVQNEGDTKQPKLVVTPCGPKTYEVLARVDGPTNGADDAKTKCSKVEGYTDWYFFNSELDGLDFVLCLKLR